MAHHTIKSGYRQLVERLNRFPQGAPPSELLYKILKMLFSAKEAGLVSLLPSRIFSAEKAGRIWKLDADSTQKILNELSGRAILMDFERNGRQVYCLPPPMAGFFEFALMRVRGDVDQKVLSELYYQYINVEEDFIKNLFLGTETKLGRVFVHEPVLSSEKALFVFDYERASEIIKTASPIGISTCYCRHKMAHVGRDCVAPKEICMTFNVTAASLVKHGFARRVEVPECLGLLETAYESNLVQFGDNVREGVNFICNCCGCCCEAMIVSRKFGTLHPIHTTNFIPRIQAELCNGCRKCIDVCPVEAMSLVSANDPRHPKKKKARLIEEICLGCGICARVCPSGSIDLQHRPQRVITPLNTTHRVVLMAIERGTLQHFIVDTQAFYSHRALAAVLGVILKLPPVKQALASRQMKSRYLEALIRRWDL
ncbi:MAG: 4Fe-4S dicluster domain-containing protein [Pseudomonadota bacterium]|uniref:4Fe-4S dicluster domain-containing protein n=1 Tax=Candidatus Desulfatibia profunda TaxID=2841695 RepID=A0A8J6TJ78_9BACT|nr:4Fe-4S dicluster domain-containing protein [Candidatus Desulfatibia profunda]MBL7180428.1 4Fe-4S dicluster domain-containing protein [Desulfobacterales bacterium]